MRILYSRKRNWVILFFLLFLVKVGILYTGVYLINSMTHRMYKIGYFADEYDDIAHNLINGRGYRVYSDTSETMIRLPGYVFVLSVIFVLFGKKLVICQIFNIFLSMLVACIIIFLSFKITDSRRLGIIASLVFLFHPAIILAESRGGVDVLFTFLVILFIATLYRSFERNDVLSFFICGCTLGLVCLVKSTPLLFPLFLSVLVFFNGVRGEMSRRIWGHIGIMIVGVSLVLSPWIIRNYVISGKIVPTMTLMGALAQEGLYATKNVGSSKSKYELGWEASRKRASFAEKYGFNFRKRWHLYFFSSEDEVRFDRLLYRHVIKEYMRTPSLFFKNTFLNFFRFWFRGGTRTSNVLNTVLTLPLLILALAGVHDGLRSGANIAPMTVFIAYFVVVHLPLFALARYHIPLIPMLSILALTPFSFLVEARDDCRPNFFR